MSAFSTAIVVNRADDVARLGALKYQRIPPLAAWTDLHHARLYRFGQEPLACDVFA